MNSTGKVSENYALNRLMDLCSRSEKSEHDIRKKLSEWGLENKSDKIVSILKSEKYVDDTRFARAFAIDKMRLNKWGKFKIRLLLKSKNINDTCLKEALSAIDENEYRHMIFAELTKKKKTLKDKDPYKLKAKIYSFGNQRGYESEVISDFLSE
jgi:regulatory protein